VEMDDVFEVIEGLVADVFRRTLGVEIPLPVPRLKYDDVMLRYGSDKPDLRFGLEIADVTALAKQSTFMVFIESAERGHLIRALNAKGAGKTISNTELKPGGKVPEYAAQFGAKGLA